MGSSTGRGRAALVSAVTVVAAGIPIVLGTGLLTAATSAVGAQTTYLVSRAAQASSQPSISPDGAFVAFRSDGKLAPADTNSVSDVYLGASPPGDPTPYDGTPELVSIGLAGAAANGASSEPSVSADGHFVAFTSAATNLVSGTDTATADIYVRDVRTGETTRVQGGALPNGASSQPVVSANGRHVVFTSLASNLVAGDTNSVRDVFRLDRETGTLTRVSTANAGGQLAAASYDPAISADGTAVSFTSENTGLDTATPTATSGTISAWHVRFGASGRTTTQIGATGNNGTGQTALSGDGTVVAYVSKQATYHGVSVGLSGTAKVFVESLGGHWEWVSDGIGTVAVSAPALSADGAAVAFVAGSRVRLAETESRYGADQTVGSDGVAAIVLGPDNSADPSVTATGRTTALTTTTSLTGDGDTAADVAVIGTASIDKALHPALDSLTGLDKPAPLPFVDPAGIPADATSAAGTRELGTTRIGTTRIGTTRIGTTRIGTTRIGTTRIGTTRIGTTRIGTTRIGDLALTAWPLVDRDGWAFLLAGTPYDGLPLDRVTLNEVLTWAEANAATNAKAQVIHTLTLAAFSTDSPIGQFSFVSILLLDKPVADIPVPGPGTNLANWTAAVTAQGFPASTVTATTTLLELEGAGVDLGVTELGLVSANQVTSAGTGFAAIKVADLFLDNPLGHVRLTDLPPPVADAVVDCSAFAGCTTGTIEQAANQGKVRADATLATLTPGLPDWITLDEEVRTLTDPLDFPWENLSFDAIGVGRFNVPENPGPGERDGLTEIARLRAAVDSGPGGPRYVQDVTLDVALPPGTAFHHASFSAVGPLEYVTPYTVDGQGHEELGSIVRFRLGDVPSGTTITVSVTGTDAVNYGQGGTLTSAIFGPDGSRDTAALVLHDFAGYAALVDPPAGNSIATAPVLDQPNRIYFGGITSADDVEYLRIPRPPRGQRLVVANGTDGGNLDLGIFQLASQASPPTNGASPAQGGTGAGALLERRLDSLGLDHMQPGPGNLFDVPGHDLLDASTRTGTQSEVVTVDGDGTPGNLLVKVQSADGRTSMRPFTIRYRYLPIEPEQRCPAYVPKHEAGPLSGGIMPQLLLPGTDTVFLVDQTRMTQEYGQLGIPELLNLVLEDAGDWVAHQLANLDGQLGLRTAVIPVTGTDLLGLHPTGAVKAARSKLDRNPCSVSASNELARAISELVATYFTPEALASVKNVVVVGGDDQIPFWRVPAATFGAREPNNEGFLRLATPRGTSCPAPQADELPTGPCDGRATPQSAAAGGDYVLTDGAYGDVDPLKVFDRDLYVEDVPVARLVESPQDIRKAVRTFLDAGGRYRADKSLVAGYGAWDELPAALVESLSGRVTTQEQLSGTWNRADLRAKLFPATGQSPNIVSINAHMSEEELLPAEGDLETTTTLPAAFPDYAQRLAARMLFTLGCHAGNALPDAWYGAPTLDMPEMLGGVGTFIASTGYGIADDAATALTERLLIEYADRLAVPGVTAGEAFRDAKNAYLDGLGLYLGYDEKILMQQAFYGLPMWRLEGTTTTPPPSPDPQQWQSGNQDGFDTRSTSFTPTYDFLSSPGGTYAQVVGQPVQHNPGEPIHARIQAQLPTIAGQTPRYGLITAMVSKRAPAGPVAVAAATSGGAGLTARYDDVAGPVTMTAVNHQRLAVIASRTEANSDPGATTGQIWTATSLSTRVTYSASADVEPPFVETRAVRNADGSRTITVQARDDGGPTRAAYLMYLQATSASWTEAAWTNVAMTRVGSSDTWTYTIPPNPAATQTFWFSQVLDGAGNGTTDTGRGYFGRDSLAAPDFDPGGDATIRLYGEEIRHIVITDPDSTRATARIDYGAGWQEMQVIRNDAGQLVAVLHLVGQTPGTFPVRMEVCDDGGRCTTKSFTLVVTELNRPPSATVTLDEHLPLTTETLHADATCSDPDEDPCTLRYQWYVGDEELTAYTGDTLPLAAVGPVEGATVTVRVTPSDPYTEGYGATDFAIVARNHPAVVTLGASGPLTEGAAYAVSGTVSDPDADDVTLSVTYGDGSGAQPVTHSGGTFALHHVYADNGTYTVTVTATDEHGATSTATATVSVANAPPVILENASPAPPGAVGSPTTISVAWTDAGTADTHTVLVSWGDGTSSQATVDQDTNTATASHTYAIAGTYVIGVTVTDDDGASVTESPYDFGVVFDSTGGYLTANGYYTSPVGAWLGTVEQKASTGKAEFGLNAKLPADSGSPTGKFRFTYDIQPSDHGCAVASCLQFDSTSFTTLTVIGSQATLKGNGTLNGVTGCSFLITVVDGSPDKVRIKIINKQNKVVYDTQPGAADTAAPTIPLSGGSVLLKKVT